ncbi:hypothetical protein ACFODZ_15980 [Marinicella sediminis]|uniref:Uncharacterized protein n=1 Tax=Marinicella sediminis TaxID=1792834 RepID=A0ABV7JC96_9GAMM
MKFPKLNSDITRKSFASIRADNIEGVDHNDVFKIRKVKDATQKVHEDNLVLEVVLKGNRNKIYFDYHHNEYSGIRIVRGKQYIVTLCANHVFSDLILAFNYHCIDEDEKRPLTSHDGTIHPIP